MIFVSLLFLTGLAHAQWQQPGPAQQSQPGLYQPQNYAPPQDPQRGTFERNLLPPPPPQQYFLSPTPQNQPINPQSQGETQRSLTPPSLKFKIGIVSGKAKGRNRDEDTGKFKSFLWEGSLYFMENKTDPTHPNITVKFVEGKGGNPLDSGLNYGGRGFQLSTLNAFNEKLYACDSKTGIVFELKKVEETDEKKDNQGEKRYDDRRGREFDQSGAPNRISDETSPEEKKYKYVAQPWVLLSNDDSNKPFKCEWGLVRDGKLWIGSTGSFAHKSKSKGQSQQQQGQQEGQLDANIGGSADYEDSSNINDPKEEEGVAENRQIVKRIDLNGQVESIDFSKHFEKIAESYEVDLRKGHVIHEAAEYSDATQQWLFIPRRVTKDAKDKATWGSLSTNKGFFVDDPFENLRMVEFGNLTTNSGVVGLRYIPGTNDKFVLALKTGTDRDGNELSQLVVYDETGYEIMPEVTVAEGNFSAVEFL